MEIHLNDNSRLRFERTQTGTLYVELLRPGNLRDGHGYLVTATAFICGQELADLVTAISPPDAASKGANAPSFIGGLHARTESASGP